MTSSGCIKRGNSAGFKKYLNTDGTHFDSLFFEPPDGSDIVLQYAIFQDTYNFLKGHYHFPRNTSAIITITPVELVDKSEYEKLKKEADLGRKIIESALKDLKNINLFKDEGIDALDIFFKKIDRNEISIQFKSISTPSIEDEDRYSKV